jgi:hypothetical protein
MGKGAAYGNRIVEIVNRRASKTAWGIEGNQGFSGEYFSKLSEAMVL